MRASLPASVLLHGGLLAWALVWFQEVKPFNTPEPEPVEVAIISEDGLTRLMQGERKAKQLQAAPAKAAPPSPAVKETPKTRPPNPTPPPLPPPPEPAKVEPPPPEPPKRDEIAELTLKAEQEAAAAAAAKAEAERKAEEERKRQEALKKKQEDERKRREALKKKQDELKRKLEEAKKKPSEDFFEDMQKALKDNDPRKRAPHPSGSQVAQASNVKGPQAGAPEGRDTKLTASEANLLGSMMKKQVTRCFNINPGVEGIEKIKIEIEVRLSPDGRIASQPRVVSRGTGPLYNDMADAALRALISCQAYELPKHLYKGGWDHMIVDFDPSGMFR